MSDTEERDIMDLFEDLSLPIKQFTLPKMVVVVPIIEDRRSSQTMDRMHSGKEYSLMEKQKERSLLGKNFSKMSLNMSGFTGASTYQDFSSNRSEVNTTITDATEPNLNFAPNKHRKDLPIYNHRDEIVQQINENPIAIITGLTGCGKTTQVPQYIYDNWRAQTKEKQAELGDCNILVSQPRKIAAITIAQRVADERKCRVGDLVGYQVGLKRELDKRMQENKLDGLNVNNLGNEDRTKILFCTTGVILQRLIHERSMQRYSHIIIDEIHERDIDTDFLLIVVRRMLSLEKPKTKIILMSATMDVNHFSDFFKIPTLGGGDFYPPLLDLLQTPRNFKIVEYFLDDFEHLAIGNSKVEEYINYEEPGISDEMFEFTAHLIYLNLYQMSQRTDVKTIKNGTTLVFLPGLYEIECLFKTLESLFAQTSQLHIDKKPSICVLHSSLSSEEQFNALLPGDKPKIILSTNIAESSLTIPNVTHVFDFCLTKYQSLVKGAQLSSLLLDWSSKQNSKQRGGRCGRLCDGCVFRMVHKEFYEKEMKEYPVSEMVRVGLETVVLKIKVLRMGSPLEMLGLALDPPDKSSIVDAILHLKELGGMLRFDKNDKFNYEDGEITFLGLVMEALPVDPRIAKLIMLGYTFSVLDEAIIIGAGLSNKSIFVHNFRKQMTGYLQKLSWAHGSGSDCIAILNAYNLWINNETNRTQLSTTKDEWCRRHNLDFKNLSEMKLLITEIKRRLENMKIARLDNQPTWKERDKIFILKICMAGAFGPSNFFLPTENTQDYEREAFKSVNNNDLFRSVVFHNMDRNLVGNVYEEQLRDTFIEKGIIDRNTEVKFKFNYKTSERILVQFGSDQQPNKGGNEDVIGIGNVPPEVYKAVKFRQLEGKLPLKVLTRDQTIQWALKHELGQINQQGVFQINNGFVKNPRLCVLPTITTTKMEGVVTHIENGNKFFFRPSKSFHENLKSRDEVNWISYEKDNVTMQALLNNAEISPVKGQLNEGELVVVKKKEIRYRALLIDQLSRDSFKVNLIDVGCIETIKSDAIFTIDEFKECIDECLKEALLSYPPRVFECTLMQVRPSVIKSRDGKWTQNAVKILREKVVNRESFIEIYSVVDDIASVKLVTGSKVVNKKLVEKKYAEESEESYLSKLDHEHRQQINAEKKSTPEEEFAEKKKEQIVKLKRCPAPPKETCEYNIKISGPFSPLETSLNGISRICRSKVNIQQQSVNSVLLNDDLLNFRSKFYVAANVTFSPMSNAIVLHDVNMMPTIPGLAVLLALIFCPTAELRRDEQKSRYVSLLTGLGFDKTLNQPFFGEHDCCLDIDFKLDENDIEKINHLRFCLSVMLRADPGCNYSNLVDGEKVKNLEMIHTLVLEILNKQRTLRAADQPFDAFDWNVDQQNVYRRTDPNGNEGIYTFLGLPKLREMSDRDKNKLRLHAVELVKCSKNTFTIHIKVCRLCGFEWTTTQELNLHLLSTEHVNRLEELREN